MVVVGVGVGGEVIGFGVGAGVVLTVVVRIGEI